jgi:hypothetical protein
MSCCGKSRADARERGGLEQPEVKSRAVGEILGYVKLINDRVVQLEITRAVGESFCLPSEVLFEGMKTGRKVSATLGRGARKKLTEAEKRSFMRSSRIRRTLPRWSGF